MTIGLKELADFLETANKSSYANANAPKAASSRLKSDDYHFEKDNSIYHDTYFGSRDFIGGEVVYKNNEPVWGMNYYGFILSEAMDHEELYRFLRKALMQEYVDIIPVRGPVHFEESSWVYKNSPEGELDRFTGTEEIHQAGILVYRAYYHGGFIR